MKRTYEAKINYCGFIHTRGNGTLWKEKEKRFLRNSNNNEYINKSIVMPEFII
jgi:hypothetical protein